MEAWLGASWAGRGAPPATPHGHRLRRAAIRNNFEPIQQVTSARSARRCLGLAGGVLAQPFAQHAAPLRQLAPAVEAAGPELEQLGVLAGVAVSVNARVTGEVVGGAHAASLLGPGAVAAEVASREDAAACLELGADELDLEPAAQILQVDPQRGRHHDDGVAALLVPGDALERLRSKPACQGLSVARAELAQLALGAAAAAQVRRRGAHAGGMDPAELVADHHGAEQRRAEDQARATARERQEGPEGVA